MVRVRRRVRFQINTIDHKLALWCWRPALWDNQGYGCTWAWGNENRKEGREKKELILARRKKQRSSGSQGGKTGCTQNVLEAWRMGGMKRKRILRSPQLIPECYTSAVKIAVKYCKCKKIFWMEKYYECEWCNNYGKRVTTFLVKKLLTQTEPQMR